MSLSEEQDFLCRWLGDDEMGWDAWEIHDEHDREIVEVHPALTHKQAAERFLAAMREEERESEDQVIDNTRIGTRRLTPTTMHHAPWGERPEAGKTNFQIQIVDLGTQAESVRWDDPDQDYMRVRASNAWEAAARAVASLKDMAPTSQESIAVREDPGAVRLFLAVGDEGSRVRIGRADELDVIV